MLGRLLAIASATVLVAASPAGAHHVVAGAVTITGSGTVTPGLMNPAIQNWSMTGQVTGSMVLHDRPYVVDMNCHFSGSGSGSGGTGNLSGSCSGTAATTLSVGTVRVSCNVSYTLAGTAMLWRGTCTFAATAVDILGGLRTVTAAGCVRAQIALTPTSTPPMTSYTFWGELEFHTAPQVNCFTAP